MTPDAINACFEGLGGLLLWINVYRLYKDKQVSGISLWPTAFFTMWGVWNLYFYPAVNAWYSFFGGLSIVLANLVWWLQMLYYVNRKQHA